MARGIRSTIGMSAAARLRGKSPSRKENSPQPGIIAALETTARILLLERPPSCHARELATTKAIGLSVGSNGRHEIEEVKDDSLPRAILHAQGDERPERVSGHI